MLVLWLRERATYFRISWLIKEYGGSKYLTMCKEESTIESSDDIGTVMDFDAGCINDGGLLKNAMIVGVLEFINKKTCMHCQSTVEPGSGDRESCASTSGIVLGCCLNCNVAQRYDLCSTRLFLKLLFRAERKDVALIANGTILQRLVGVSDNSAVKELDLLMVPTLATVSFNGQDVITKFEFKSLGTPV